MKAGTPPRVPICRDADDASRACRFAAICHENRQRLAHYSSPPLRGNACWAYEMLTERAIKAEGGGR